MNNDTNVHDCINQFLVIVTLVLRNQEWIFGKVSLIIE